jgi:hypothetical protein
MKKSDRRLANRYLNLLEAALVGIYTAIRPTIRGPASSTTHALAP